MIALIDILFDIGWSGMTLLCFKILEPMPLQSGLSRKLVHGWRSMFHDGLRASGGRCLLAGDSLERLSASTVEISKMHTSN